MVIPSYSLREVGTLLVETSLLLWGTSLIPVLYLGVLMLLKLIRFLRLRHSPLWMTLDLSHIVTWCINTYLKSL